MNLVIALLFTAAVGLAYSIKQIFFPTARGKRLEIPLALLVLSAAFTAASLFAVDSGVIRGFFAGFALITGLTGIVCAVFPRWQTAGPSWIGFSMVTLAVVQMLGFFIFAPRNIWQNGPALGIFVGILATLLAIGGIKFYTHGAGAGRFTV